MTRDEEMVIFTRTFDFLSWLLPMMADLHDPLATFLDAHVQKPAAFAKQKPSGFLPFTRRLLDAAFDLRKHLEIANLRRGRARLEQLRLADEALAQVRVYLRLAVRWQWLSGGQYRHAAEMVTEIGRLLGGWVDKIGRRQTVGARLARGCGLPLTGRGGWLTAPPCCAALGF